MYYPTPHSFNFKIDSVFDDVVRVELLDKKKALSKWVVYGRKWFESNSIQTWIEDMLEVYPSYANCHWNINTVRHPNKK